MYWKKTPQTIFEIIMANEWYKEIAILETAVAICPGTTSLLYSTTADQNDAFPIKWNNYIGRISK